MVVEIAASNISEDRLMAKVYGQAGIPVYWIVNLKARQVEVYSLLKLKRRGPAGWPRLTETDSRQCPPHHATYQQGPACH